ncbi:MAG: N-methyl-L-tryptophan oxidase [Anaerolineae bacterium]
MKKENHYDLIIVGLGAMGSAALYQAAKRGINVLGIDRFDPPHEMGSSHAETRLTRMAVGEGAEYVPLVTRANEIWRELEEKSGQVVLYQDGLYIVAPKNPKKEEYNHWENFIERSAEVAAEVGVEYEVLTSAEVRERNPKMLIPDSDYAGFEPTGGQVMAERAVELQLKFAKEMGANVRPNSPVTGIEQKKSGGVQVETADATFTADKVILSAGAWTNDFMPQAQHKNFKVTRQVVYWFEVDNPEEYRPSLFPGTLWVGETLADYVGLFAIPEGGIPGLKMLTEQYSDISTAHDVSRDVSKDEIEYFFKTFAGRKVAGIKPNCLKASVCLYTHTPDDHFVIDWHPHYAENVLLVSACSSHGFKHSAAVGESAVQMAISGKSEIPLDAFKLDRLTTIKAHH